MSEEKKNSLKTGYSKRAERVCCSRTEGKEKRQTVGCTRYANGSGPLPQRMLQSMGTQKTHYQQIRSAILSNLSIHS